MKKEFSFPNMEFHNWTKLDILTTSVWASVDDVGPGDDECCSPDGKGFDFNDPFEFM